MESEGPEAMWVAIRSDRAGALSLDVPKHNGAFRMLPGQGDRNSEEDGVMVRYSQVEAL